MQLQNIQGNLLKYKALQPGTFQCVDQLINEIRTNVAIREDYYYTGDGQLYTVHNHNPIWAITREPQNLVLENINEVYRQLLGQNYYPDPGAAQASLDHPDTVVVNIRGLELIDDDDDEYGHIIIDPTNLKKLNFEQRKVVKRIYGPDEEHLGLNMERFARTKKIPQIIILKPEYITDVLASHNKEFIARASWLVNYSFHFNAADNNVNCPGTLRGVCLPGDAPKTETSEQEELIRSPTMDEILSVSRRYVSEFDWKHFKYDIGKLYKK